MLVDEMLIELGEVGAAMDKARDQLASLNDRASYSAAMGRMAYGTLLKLAERRAGELISGLLDRAAKAKGAPCPGRLYVSGGQIFFTPAPPASPE